MSLISVLLDVGNIVFFIANFPQMVNAYENRKNLKGLSTTMLLGYMIATLFFISVGLLTNGHFTAILGMINEVFFGLQFYWKRKYR